MTWGYLAWRWALQGMILAATIISTCCVPGPHGDLSLLLTPPLGRRAHPISVLETGHGEAGR